MVLMLPSFDLANRALRSSFAEKNDRNLVNFFWVKAVLKFNCAVPENIIFHSKKGYEFSREGWGEGLSKTKKFKEMYKA